MSSRELINTGTDKRYVRRDERGRFARSVDVGRSLTKDRRQAARTESRHGQGDRGPGAMMTMAEVVARRIADELIRRAGLPPVEAPPWDVRIPLRPEEKAALALLEQLGRTPRR